MSFAKLDELGRKLEALEHALAILGADEATHMAVGGGAKRAEAMSALAGMYHRQATAPEIDRLVVELLLLGGIFTLSNAAQLDLRFLARALGRPDAMQTDGEPTRTLAEAILDDVAALARREDAEAEAGEFVVPDDVIFGAAFSGVNDSFCELRHGLSPTQQRSLA